jgi:thioredoxin 1
MAHEVLYFSAAYCGPCIVVGKSVEKLAKDFLGITFTKVDAETDVELVERHEVRALPTLIHLKDGQEIARVSGARTKEDIAIELAL